MSRSARHPKARRTLAAIPDTVASVGAKRQRRQSDRSTPPTYALAHHNTLQQLSARCSVYGKVSRRKSNTLKWLHPASLPMKTIIWCCFAARVDVAMLESEEIELKGKKKKAFGVESALN